MTTISYAQVSVNTSGGNATGSGGTMSYSIGQTDYSYQTTTSGEVSQGVQHAYEIFVIGLDEKDSDISLQIYPNPTSDYLTLSMDEIHNESVKYQIIDITGKSLQKGSLTQSATKLDFTPFRSGSYFILISNGSEKLKTFKIIKN